MIEHARNVFLRPIAIVQLSIENKLFRPLQHRTVSALHAQQRQQTPRGIDHLRRRRHILLLNARQIRFAPATILVLLRDEKRFNRVHLRRIIKPVGGAKTLLAHLECHASKPNRVTTANRPKPEEFALAALFPLQVLHTGAHRFSNLVRAVFACVKLRKHAQRLNARRRALDMAVVDHNVHKHLRRIHHLVRGIATIAFVRRPTAIATATATVLPIQDAIDSVTQTTLTNRKLVDSSCTI
mmetsp:Transcript_25692/g.41956  ORF Transcript_25692/g.41956 Transcript_25692/m.41956 type:complete len:240 (+) Transcript_25692:170-889(+)